MIKLAEQLELEEEEREAEYKSDQLEETISKIFPEEFDKSLERSKLEVRLDYIKLNLGEANEYVKMLTDGKKGAEAADYIINKSEITTKEDVVELAGKSSKAILNSDDPFIKYILETRDELAEYQKINTEISQTEDVLEQELGEVLFTLYGTSIPPDANRSMRIGDGTVRTVEYNGTIAPYKTTYYGLFDRYYSHQKEFPWNLPDRWVNHPKEFDLSTAINFITDIDVIGGQSGSPIVDRDGELVGLAFDGNIDSIIGSFIFMPHNNRSLSVAAEGMLEALRHIYKTDRIVSEILNSKIVN